MKRLVGLAAVLALASGTTVLAQAAGAAGPAAAPAAGAVNPPAASTGPASETPAARTNPLTPAPGVDAAAPPAAGAINSPVGVNATTTAPGANTGVGVNASTSPDTVIGNTPAGQAPSAYPPCTSRTQDRCVQKGAKRSMKPRSSVAPASGPATTG